MSVIARYHDVSGAFDRDTLRLLHQKYAPVIVAVLGEVFSEDDQRVVAEDDLHDHVDFLLEQISDAVPDTELPQQRGRALAYSWVEGAARGWLRYKDGSTPSGPTTYEITNEALDALRYVRETGRHAMVSESRVKDLITKVQDTALMISEDRERRIGILSTQIEKLTEERDRLLSGGDLEFAGTGEVIEVLDQILSEVNNLPSDIRKVGELFADMREQLRQEFRDDDRSTGEVLDLYRQRMDALLNNDDRGRAFVGAVELLQKTGMMRAFATDMDIVLAHEAAQGLKPEERRRLKRTSRELSREVQQVMVSHRHIVQTIYSYLSAPDRIQATELRTLLRELDRRLSERKAVAKVRSRVPIAFVPATIELDRLRTNLADPADFAAPPAARPHLAIPMSAEEQRELLRMGGPDVDKMRGILITRLKAFPRATVAEVFNALPREDRRLVDLFALFEASADTMALRRSHTAGLTDRYLTVHPLGIEERVFEAPRLTYTDEDRSVLIANMERAQQ
ncbi:MAG: DUF3375 domain-containing protein [Comamonadaceae bacterium]|nr:MAG: DUF3375 domain-containing protein [Comamonadaceae bacterium]